MEFQPQASKSSSRVVVERIATSQESSDSKSEEEAYSLRVFVAEELLCTSNLQTTAEVQYSKDLYPEKFKKYTFQYHAVLSANDTRLTI